MFNSVHGLAFEFLFLLFIAGSILLMIYIYIYIYIYIGNIGIFTYHLLGVRTGPSNALMAPCTGLAAVFWLHN